MNSGEWYILLICAACVFLVYQFYFHQKKNKEEFIQKAKKEWGKILEKEEDYEQLERAAHFFQNYKDRAKNLIDDITWNDLDMDGIFQMMNHTYSSIGEEYLYWILRTPVTEEEAKEKKILSKRDYLIHFFSEHEDERIKLQLMFKAIGKMRTNSISDYVMKLFDVERLPNLHHYLMFGALLLSVILLFLIPSIGILCLIASLGCTIYQYFKEKGKVEIYFSCFAQIASMLHYVEELEKMNIEQLSPYVENLKKAYKNLKSFQKGVKFLGTNNMTGSFAEILLDYVRILTHIDLIKFNQMLQIFHMHSEDIEILMQNFGLLESMIAVASFRESMPYYCIPEFISGTKAELMVEQIYHPQIQNPVANSITERKGALITGSNASGKSTFLKTIAINAILSQTIYTALAKSYQANYFKILSSMALQDNLMEQESYYIVEIKSLKRILDSAKEGKAILCFVDEVLRGTNTVERIAASAQILKSLSSDNVLCFAATHDIELTYMLEDIYSNYHFQEEVIEEKNDILFDYILYSGRAVSRNAIKLLSMIGYEKEIIKRAERSAEEFLKKGEWRC